MVGQRILQGEDVSCGDDAEASATAERALGASGPPFDAIEVWRGTVRVCRHERALMPNGH